MILFERGDSLPDDRVVLTGARRAGKDFVATESGTKAVGVADPIYELSKHYLLTDDKSEPGVREFQQDVGAVGRGEEPSRSAAEIGLPMNWESVETDIRIRGASITGMGSKELWEAFGRDSGFWVRVLEGRIEDMDGRVAVPNGRFPDEVNRLTRHHGFAHYHVMCSDQTRRERLEEAGETMGNGTATDVTEQLAAELNRIASTGSIPPSLLKKAKRGDSLWRDLRPTVVLGVAERESVVWSDERRLP